MFRRKQSGEPAQPLTGIYAPEKLDLISINADESAVSLHVVQADEWEGSDEQLRLLQEKIHNYVSYALDGQLEREYPEAASLPWEIVIDCQTDLDPRTAEVLEALGRAVEKYGGSVTVRKLSS